MDRLDTLVVDHLNERLFPAHRLKDLLACVLTKRAEREAEVDGRVTRLHAGVTEAADKLARLYQMVENGLTDLDDILKGSHRGPEERPRSGQGSPGPST